jgi:homopolymeric O-antigen transport system permease protein
MAAPSVLSDVKSTSSPAAVNPTAPVEVSAGLAGLPVHVIEAQSGWVPVRLGELWEYRELLYFFVWRELKIRYKQTLLGVAWAVIQPLFTMVVFTLLFGRLAKVPSDGLPYPVFTFCALLPWQLFSFALTESSNSVVAQQRLLTKVYFPRLLMPLASVCVGLADFAIAFVMLIAMMAYYGIVPGLAALTIPLWTILAMATALGIGLWLAALNVRYRDIRYTVPFLTQVWMYATPVAYASSLIPQAWRPFYALNPMVGVIEGFRWALLGQAPTVSTVLPVSVTAVALLLASGLFYFRRTERTFADIV